LCGTAPVIGSIIMVKKKSTYVCQQCSYETAGWLGKCPNCGEWNSLVETVVLKEQKSRRVGGRESIVGQKPVLLTSVKSKDTKRISTKISELDRVLGGGLVGGQVILVAGEPGIGKSTILLQLADKLGTQQKKTSAQSLVPSVLYASGEESVNQIKIRADRLGVKSKTIQVIEETDVDEIINQGSSINNSTTLIVDSIQTMTTSDLSGMAGSVGQVRECTFRLVKLAKSTSTTVFIVGHVTKQGSIAGPSVLMHLVDTVLWFEGDKSLTLRLLRAVKNRFGPTDEVGVFSMEDKGLVSLSNPEKLFLSKVRKAVSGNVVTSIMQGTRPMLIEIQALVVPTRLAYPKRIAQGIDSKRLELLLAVLQRRCGLPLHEYDCFVNVAGGITIKNDPSSDLAICLSVASAYLDKPISRNSLAVGEVGLLGDIREVVAQEKRIKEARRLGYKYTISSKSAKYLQETIGKYLK
jgi:DNA repair protein RadA/Sms